MKKFNFAVMALMLVAPSLMTGCGKTQYVAGNNPDPGSAPFPIVTATPLPTPTATSTPPVGLLPPIAYTFNIQGAGTVTATDISTDNILKVTIRAGASGYIPNTGYTIAFSCVRYTVSAGGKSLTAFVSNTGGDGTGPCAGAKPEVTLDFSDRLFQGHGPMSVSVTNNQYDNCRLYGYVDVSGCPLTNVYSTHTIPGSMDVHVNGTY